MLYVTFSMGLAKVLYKEIITLTFMYMVSLSLVFRFTPSTCTKYSTVSSINYITNFKLNRK